MLVILRCIKKNSTSHLSASVHTQGHLRKSLLVTSDHWCKRKQVFLLKVFDSFGTDISVQKHLPSDNYLATIAIKIKQNQHGRNPKKRPKLYVTIFIKLHLCSKFFCTLHICQDLLIRCWCAAYCSRVQLQLAIIKNNYSFYFSTCSLKSTVVIKLFPLSLSFFKGEYNYTSL